MTFIAGPYTATMNSLAIGQVEDGFEVENDMAADTIRGDQLGDSDQDGVYRGGNTYINLTLLEFDAAGAQTLFWPHLPATWGRLGTVGALLSAMISPLVLTKTAGSNALWTTFTAARAILAPGFPTRTLFASRLRRVPIRLKLYPYQSSSNYVWFTAA